MGAPIVVMLLREARSGFGQLQSSEPVRGAVCATSGSGHSRHKYMSQGELLRAASSRAQAKSAHMACDKSTRRANHQNSVHPLAKKYFAFVVGQISGLNRRVPPEKRGVAHVTNVVVGCGGRG
jgi:hypothetical protein